MKPFRYDDEARTFGESLAEIKVAAPAAPEPNVGALERILQGDTALSKMAEERAMAHASVPEDLAKHELKKKLHALLQDKQKKTASVRAGIDAFVARAEKIANPTMSDVTPGMMTSGNGQPIPQPEPVEAPMGASSQGPAADLFARALKQHNSKQVTQSKVAASRLDKGKHLFGTAGHLRKMLPDARTITKFLR
jgi:hypothetical protein